MSIALEALTSRLAASFPPSAEIEHDGTSKIRVVYKLKPTGSARRYSRPIVILVDSEVLAEINRALSAGDAKRRKEIEDGFIRLVQGGLAGYDENGRQDSAHRIEVDDRACDRS